MSKSQFQVIVLDSPYNSFFNPQTQRYLTQALRLKLRSYQNVYAPGVLPLDTYDFISTHHLIGRGSGRNFQPLMVFRTTPLDRCAAHRLAFPGLAVLRGSGAEQHASELQKRLEQWSHQGLRVSYGSGWAIAPELRENRELRNILKDLMTAMLVNYEVESRTDRFVACGVVRVHTEEYFQSIGYRIMTSQEGDLEPFPQASLIGSNAVLLEAEKFNARALRLAEQYRDLWEARHEISQINSVIPLKKTA